MGECLGAVFLRLLTVSLLLFPTLDVLVPTVSCFYPANYTHVSQSKPRQHEKFLWLGSSRRVNVNNRGSLALSKHFPPPVFTFVHNFQHRDLLYYT